MRLLVVGVCAALVVHCGSRADDSPSLGTHECDPRSSCTAPCVSIKAWPIDLANKCAMPRRVVACGREEVFNIDNVCVKRAGDVFVTGGEMLVEPYYREWGLCDGDTNRLALSAVATPCR